MQFFSLQTVTSVQDYVPMHTAASTCILHTVHTKFLKILFSTLLYFEKIKFFQRLEMNFLSSSCKKKKKKNLFVIYTNSNSIIMSNSISKHKRFIFCNLVESLAMQNLKYVTIESTLIEIEICIILMN